MSASFAPVDLDTVGSEGWWLNRLTQRLGQRFSRYQQLDNYYRGEHRLPEGDQRCSSIYKHFQHMAMTNYMPMVSDAVRERLCVTGFNAGSKAPKSASDVAWQAWQANHLDALSNRLHSASLVLSDAYAIVGPTPAGADYPLVTVEDPRQVITESNPANELDVRAGLKTWCDPVEQYRYAVLYLPDAIHYYRSQDVTLSVVNQQIYPTSGLMGFIQPGSFASWEEYEDPVANPIGEVPVVRFVSDPMITAEGWGEFERVMNIQDRFNFLTLNMMVVVTVQAFRQRWVKGIAIEDPETGEKLDLSQFMPGADLLWAVEDSDVTFGEFDEVDLTPFITAIERTEAEIVKLAGLPPHYVMGDLVNASADALAAAEARLVSKTEDRQLEYGESWERVERLMFSYMGKKSWIKPDAQVLWKDAQRSSIITLTTAGAQAAQAGLPWKERMALMGNSDAQIGEMEADRLVPEEPTVVAERITATAAPPPGEKPAATVPAPPSQPPAGP